MFNRLNSYKTFIPDTLSSQSDILALTLLPIERLYLPHQPFVLCPGNLCSLRPLQRKQNCLLKFLGKSFWYVMMCRVFVAVKGCTLCLLVLYPVLQNCHDSSSNSNPIPFFIIQILSLNPVFDPNLLQNKKDKSPMQKSELERLEIELSDAKKAVRDLASQIEEANLRSKGLQRKPKWRQEEDAETSAKNEDARYAEVMMELKHMQQELGKLKLDMARVMKEKRHAERSSKASSFKTSNLLASMELMKKELQELGEKQAVVEFALIEADNDHLAITLEQLRTESVAAKKDKDTINADIENMNEEIRKTDHEIDVAEERLEAAMEELKTIKSSETKALGILRNLINTTAKTRDTASTNSSMITITNFEYEYLTGKAGGAAELADKKIAAAQAWVEALKASERELLMKIETTQNEIGELSIKADPDANTEVPGPGSELGLQGKVVASPRRLMSKLGNKVFVKRVRSQKFRAPAARYSGKLGSMQRERMIAAKLRKKSVAMDEGVI
ncbi:hypothetical protein E3N88_02421 [Mikania micrantha]|uniref:WEB family protein n=1 Tax=Mikania micrantha TaxID=192012 RepID=A0A5N6Q3Q7_9ASTR|nr:hypothetical protein E3N88_02421 [Mikania micrantha]